MKQMKTIIKIVFIVYIGTIHVTNPSDTTPSCPDLTALNDLEYYIGTTECLQRYFYCKNDLEFGTNCLLWADCSHMRTLMALIQAGYIRENILSGNKQLQTQINNILTQYGRDNLDNLIKSYQTSILAELISDLISALNSSSDTSILTNAGMQLYPINPVTPANQ